MTIDRVAALQAFVAVAETGGFSRAAARHGLSRARVSRQIQQLEDHLGVRLLHRTTRHVGLTDDGAALLARGRDWLEDLEDIESVFAGPDAALSGRVRVDMNRAMARDLVIPHLPAFLAAHPRLDVELSTSDHLVDPVRDGLDCVVRVGRRVDSQLIARPLGELSIINCASPAYLERHGRPETPDDLIAGHRLVHYLSSREAEAPCFVYEAERAMHSREMKAGITVTDTLAYTEACLAGLGLIQVPRTGVRAHLAAGRLIEVLPGYRAPAMPIAMMTSHRRNRSRRVQVFMDWLGALIQSDYVS